MAAGTSSVGLEQAVGIWKAAKLLDRIKGKTWSELNKKDFSESEWDAINKLYYRHRKDKSKWTFEGGASDIVNAWSERFGEGGLWDIKPDMSPTVYARTWLGKDYEPFIAWLLSEKNNLWNEAGMMKEGGLSYYIPTDEKGNKISGTITLRLEMTDGSYRDIPTQIEEGVIKSITNQPVIQVER